MDWSYGFDSKASNKKVPNEEYDDFDETKGKPNEDRYVYSYEEGRLIRKPAAVVVDGGQRKSSIPHYPNVDGSSDSYVVRTERVVKVVRPVMTTTHYSLKEDKHDNLRMAKSFLDQFLKEAAMPGAPVQSRTYWGGRDDSPFKYDQFSPPSMGTMTKFPRTGSTRNWLSRDESPPRFVTHSPWNHLNRSGGTHDWPSRDESPPRSMMRPDELNHINSSNARPNWPRRYNSPPPSTRRFASNHRPNSSARSNWQTGDDFLSRFLKR